MKNPIAQFSIAAMLMLALLLFGNTRNATLYAQIINAMEKTATFYAQGYGLQEGQMVKIYETWYKHNAGIKMTWQDNGITKCLIDDGRFCWTYQQSQGFAVKRQSVNTENCIPKEITETIRYVEKCTKDGIELINNVPCRLYTGSYPDKPDSTRVMFWIDANSRLRRFQEKVLENNVWKTIEQVDIEYDVNIDISLFKPAFGASVEIIDEDRILGDRFSLEKAVFKREEMGLIFAVHEIQRCQDDLIFTVSSLRPTEETIREIAAGDTRAWNYGDYQFGSCYERIDNEGHGTSYSPVEVAWFYCNGLIVRWTVFVPRGFEAGILNECKLELHYLYASGKLAAKRKEAGLPDRVRIKPIAVLPLPENTESIESRLSQTYNVIKMLEPMTAEKHLQLKSVPFTDQEMEDYIRRYPDSGETRKYRFGDRSENARLHHGQTQKPSQIEFECWLKDRLAYIENYKMQ